MKVQWKPTCYTCILFAAVTVLVALGVTRSIDSRAWSAIQPLRDTLYTASTLLSISASLWATLVLAALHFAVYRDTRSTLGLVASLAASMAVAYLLKNMLMVPRPLPVYTGYSYPSGHTARATVVAYWFASRAERRWIHIAAWSWAAAVAASRILLGAHWVSDVAGGALLGLCASMLTVRALQVANPRVRTSTRWYLCMCL